MQDFICYYTFMDNELYVTLIPIIELCYSYMNRCNTFYFMMMFVFLTVSFST